MIESRLLRAWGGGCARSFVVYIAAAVVMIGGFCCLTAGAFMLPIDDDAHFFIWGGLLLAFIFLVTGGVIAWGVGSIRKRAGELDAAFTPLGLTGKMYLQNGRQYHGTVRGHQVDVYVYRGPTLQIYLAASLGTRVGISRKGSIQKIAANILDKETLDVGAPGFEHLSIYPLDHRWTRELVTDPQAREIILRLTEEQAAAELRTLVIQPNAVLLQLNHTQIKNITPENVRAWIDDLWELARIADGLYPPTKTAEESKLELTTRTERSKYTWPTIGITCGVFAVMVACMVGVAAIFILLTEGGF
ncbi:MAG: hypothetical protein ABIG63_16375 [Chloroflexota bacterium]